MYSRSGSREVNKSNVCFSTTHMNDLHDMHHLHHPHPHHVRDASFEQEKLYDCIRQEREKYMCSLDLLEKKSCLTECPDENVCKIFFFISDNKFWMTIRRLF